MTGQDVNLFNVVINYNGQIICTDFSYLPPNTIFLLYVNFKPVQRTFSQIYLYEIESIREIVISERILNLGLFWGDRELAYIVTFKLNVIHMHKDDIHVLCERYNARQILPLIIN